MSSFTIYDSSGLKELLARTIVGTSLTTSEDNSLARWDGVLAQTVQDSEVFVDDSDNVTIATGGSITFAGSGSIVFTEAGGTDTAQLRGPNSIPSNYSIVLPATGGTVGQGLYIASVANDEFTLGWASTGVDPSSGFDNNIVLWNDTSGDSFTGSNYSVLDDGTVQAPTGSEIVIAGSGTVTFTAPGGTNTVSLGLQAGGGGTGFYILPNQGGAAGDFLSVIDIDTSLYNYELAWHPGLMGATGATGVNNDGIFSLDIVNNVMGGTGMGVYAGANTDNILCGWNSAFSLNNATGNLVIGYDCATGATGATYKLSNSTIIGQNSWNGAFPNQPRACSIGSNIFTNVSYNDTYAGEIAIGHDIAPNLTTGYHDINCSLGNTILQIDTLTTSGDYANGVYIGNDVGRCAQYSIFLGRKVLLPHQFREHRNSCTNIGIGLEAMKNHTSDRAYEENVGIGYQVLSAATGESSTDRSVAIGTRAGFNTNTGTNIITIGYESMGGYEYQGRSGDIAIGRRALYSVTGIPTGPNIAIGTLAGNSLGYGGYNLLIGTNAMANAITGLTGNCENVIIGTDAGLNLAGAPDRLQNYANVIVGYQAANACTTGAYHTVIGHQTGQTLSSGTGCILIGAGVDVDVAASNNRIAIGAQATGASGDGALYLRHRSIAAVQNSALWDGDELVEDTSSIRFKRDVRTYKDPNDKLFDSVRPVWYKSKPGCGMDTDVDIPGLIAEELAKLYPEYVVFEDGKCRIAKGIDYSRMVALLIDKLQRLNESTKIHRNKLEKLEKLVEHLVKMV